MLRNCASKTESIDALLACAAGCRPAGSDRRVHGPRTVGARYVPAGDAAPDPRVDAHGVPVIAASDPAGGGPVELLPLALSRPHDALTRARLVLADRPAPLDA